MSSISSSATAPLPVRFVLNRCVPNEATQRSDELARQRAAKRKAQHEVEMLALEWSKIMLEKTIHAALDPATDPALAAKLREQVINRGIGRVRDQEPDEDAKKQKSGSVEGFLEALAAISAVQSAIERTPPRIGHTERDVTPSDTVDDLQQLLDDIEGEGDE